METSVHDGPSRRRGGWWNEETRRYPWMLAVGVLWALAYPFPGLAGLAWLVPGCMFYGVVGLPRAGAFRCGYVAGLVHFLVSLRWLLHMPEPAGALAGWLALAGYLSLFPGTWLAACAMLIPDAPAADSDDAPAPRTNAGPAILTPLSGQPVVSARVQGSSEGAGGAWRRRLLAHSSRGWTRRLFVPLAAAALWVALEMFQARLFSGFPWNFIGVSQWRQLPLIQIASATGVYGVSFLVCWTSIALAGGCAMAVLRSANRWLWLAEARLPLFAVLVSIGIGFFGILRDRRAEVLSRPPSRVRLALVQPSVPQTLQWDPAEAERSFAKIEALSRNGFALRPDALVWPEGSFGLTDTNFPRMAEATKAAGCEWVFGETDREVSGNERRSYNAAFLMGNDGRVRTTYRKRRLVIFGEYVPLARWLPFLKWLTPIGDGFDSGDRPVPMTIAGLGVERGGVASPVICFEDIFPHGLRDHAGPDVDFLLELTNDAWFSESGAQWQHAANAAFRAVENGLPLVRCTNNGLTCWFDRHGGLRDLLGESGAGVYASGVLMVEIPCAGANRAETFYHRHGDVFGWGCVAYGAFALWRVARPSPRLVSSPRPPIPSSP